MIPAAESVVTDYHNPSRFRWKRFQGHGKALLNNFRLRNLKKNHEKFSTLAIFLHKNIQENIYHSTMFLRNSTMHSSEYNERKKSKNWDIKAELRERILLLDVERHFD